MPELPEVEHAARCLRAWLDGRTVIKAEAPDSRVFRGGDRRAFGRLLAGRTLQRLDRRGKNLLIAFDGGVGVFSHLGMTGKWLRRAAPAPGVPREPAPSHSRARLRLDDESVLHYCDPRMFGRIAVHRDRPLTELPEIRALGPDPLLDGLDAAALHRALAPSARPIKVALLDQALIAGLGNIHATEALFRAGIDPRTPGRRLPLAAIERLIQAIHASLDHAFAVNGSGTIAYLSEGDHVPNDFLIYDRAGQPCPRCGSPLTSMSLGGRTTAFCARCQT
ncbi:MAG: bifunctional DNA-formamidopyrimidine glycosylase/DNA-(apurinic or apyrimidinic site) lyase [Byssovorax sp.]